MAISVLGEVLAAALWPQGDIRDPLGVWGCRVGVTGDASGGLITATFQVPTGRGAAYVYTCYSAQIGLLSGAVAGITSKCRLLTNWPNIDVAAGVQGFSTLQFISMNGGTDFPSPLSGPLNTFFLSPLDRFILLFDPRPGAGSLNIVELTMGENTLNSTYSFEGYGYFWDRSVLNAPGGPRHPGAS